MTDHLQKSQTKNAGHEENISGFHSPPILAAILDCLKQQAQEQVTVLHAMLSELSGDYSRGKLFKFFALLPRHFRPEPLRREIIALQSRHDIKAVFDQQTWTLSDLARVCLLLGCEQILLRLRGKGPAEINQAEHANDPEIFADLDYLFNSADVGELIVLYRMVHLFEHAKSFESRMREGARSNIIPVFCAVSQHNPYPARYFDDEGWNQLILKAVFNDCRLGQVEGLEERSNPALTRMLSDYICERWIAKRQVPWDIWRAMTSSSTERADSTLIILESAVYNEPGRALANWTQREGIDKDGVITDDFKLTEACRIAAGLRLKTLYPERFSAISAKEPELFEKIAHHSWQSLSKAQ